MITDGKKWHYLAVKRVSALLRGITSNHNGGFYCLNCFHSYRTKNKLKKQEKVRNDHDYCYVEMPNEDNKILKYNQGEKSLKAPAIIYADLFACKNLLQRRKLCIRFLVTHCLEIVHWCNKKQTWLLQRRRLYRKVLKGLKRSWNENNQLWRKKMILLTDEEYKSYEKQKVCYIYRKKCRADKNYTNAFKLYHKVRDLCH